MCVRLQSTLSALPAQLLAPTICQREGGGLSIWSPTPQFLAALGPWPTGGYRDPLPGVGTVSQL